ncbi:hypothetical protein [Parapedobacter pyrenivorans]|nr:hypothetical protein [Parapedobacter pyrenivorans]
MRSVWKWSIGVAVCAIAVVAIANWYVNYSLKPKMEVALKKRVVDGTNGHYRLTYDELELSLLAGNATATNIRLTPAMSADTRHRPAATIYHLRIGRLKINGVGLLRLLISNRLTINTITIDTPSFRIVRHRQVDTGATDSASKPVHEQITQTLSGIKVNRIVLQAGEFELADEHDATHLHIQKITGTARDIRIDSASLLDTARLYGAKAIQLEAETVDYVRPDSLYHLQIGPLHFQTTKEELVLHNLRYGPTLSKAAFYRRTQLAKDISNISISRIGLTGIDITRWVSAQTIAAAALHIDSGSIAIYKDKTQPNPPENKIGKSPHQQLLRLEQPVAIDSVLIGALDIGFTEVSDQTGKAGTVTFETTSGVIRNLTNDSLALVRNRFMELHARSRVMGAGDLTVDFRFDLRDSLGAHKYRAQLGPMSGTPFNKMLTPQLHVEIEHVAIQGLRFDMEANDRRTAGTLHLDYDNLKVNMLREDNEGGTSTKPIVSFFANRFLLNDSNPDANGVRHTGQVYIERPYSFSFFKMIWRSIREGTKECIGL